MVRSAPPCRIKRQKQLKRKEAAFNGNLLKIVLHALGGN